MPDPLSSDTVTQLKSDPTAALAASLILAGSFPDLVSWAMRALGGKDCAANCELKANGVKPPGSVLPRAFVEGSSKGRGNGVGKSGGAKKVVRAKGPHNPREAAAKHDQVLLALMRANPDASVTEIIRMNGRPRNSTVLSL